MTVKEELKKELGRFCQFTSVKGIPRAVKAENKGLRIIWVVAIILMLTAASYQVSILIMEYMEYPTYTVTNERIFDPYDDPPVLPSLTICNENLFSSMKPVVNMSTLSTLETYYAMIDKFTECIGCDNQHVQAMELYRWLARNPNGYFQNVGEQNSKLMGHEQQNFIIECQEMIFVGLTYIGRPCTTLINISLSSDMNFFNCYRIELPNDYDMNIHGMVAGISIVLYLDNSKNYNGYQSKVNNTQSIPISNLGAIVVPTHHQGNAFTSLDGIHLPAGFSTNVQLSAETHQRLKHPYGKCEDIDVHGYEGLKMCLSDCFQHKIKLNCNCTEARLSKHMETQEKPFCLKIDPENPLNVIQNALCGIKYISADTLQECESVCPQACIEYHFEGETSFSKWPNPLSMHTFYDAYIHGRDYENKFQVVKDVITGNCSDEIDCVVKDLVAQNLITNNFLKLQYHLSDVRYMYTEEKVKIGIADFFSKIGGTLNLWAGITFVLVLEVLELLGRILLLQFQNKHINGEVKMGEQWAEKVNRK